MTLHSLTRYPPVREDWGCDERAPEAMLQDLVQDMFSPWDLAKTIHLAYRLFAARGHARLRWRVWRSVERDV